MYVELSNGEETVSDAVGGHTECGCLTLCGGNRFTMLEARRKYAVSSLSRVFFYGSAGANFDGMEPWCCTPETFSRNSDLKRNCIRSTEYILLRPRPSWQRRRSAQVCLRVHGQVIDTENLSNSRIRCHD